MLKIMWKILLPLLSVWGIEINPTTLEWVAHFVGGSQSPKMLPPHLIPYTKRHLCLDLDEYFCGCTLRGVARCYDEEGYPGTDWYRHPTAGVVGGFEYKLVSWEDKFVFHCKDTWDFNSSTDKGEDYTVPLPKNVDVATLRKILKRFGVPLCKGVYNDYLGISEAWLCQFNKNHAFETHWTIDIEESLSCTLPTPPLVLEIILENLEEEGFGYLCEQVSKAYDSPHPKTRILLEKGASLWFNGKYCGDSSVTCKTKELFEKYQDLNWCFSN